MTTDDRTSAAYWCRRLVCAALDDLTRLLRSATVTTEGD